MGDEVRLNNVTDPSGDYYEYSWYKMRLDASDMTLVASGLAGDPSNLSIADTPTSDQIGWWIYARYAVGICGVQPIATVGTQPVGYVNVAAPPTPAINTSDEAGCIGTLSCEVALSGNNPSVGSGEWSVVSGPSTSASQFDDIGVHNTTFTPSGGEGDYVVRWATSNYPCPWTTSEATITVNYPEIDPDIVASLSSGDAIWNGLEDTDYNDNENWYIYNGSSYEIAESLPTTSTNVVIPKTGTCIENSPNLGAATRSVRDLFIEDGVTLTIGSGTLNISGDFINNGTFTPGTGTINFNGSTLQELGGTTSTTFYNLTLNNSGGGASQLELDQDISIANNLTLTNGAFDLNNHTIDLGATGSLVGENNSNYVFCDCSDGYIRASGLVNTADVVHNLGSLGFEITPSSGKPLGDVEIIRRHQRITAVDGLEESISRIYEVAKNGGGSVDNNGSLDAEIGLSYLTHELNGIPAEELSLYRQPVIGVDSWYEYGGSVDVGSQKITFEGWNEFSGLTGGEFVSPLPVTYLGMQATCDGAGNILFWQTASEQNSYYFDIERSIDGYEWEKVGRVQAAGNTSSESNYEFIDEEATVNFEGYYRLKQVDTDGSFVYLPPISVFCNTSTDLRLEIYPNPTTGVTNTYVYYDGSQAVDGSLTITDAIGKLIYSRNVTLQNGGNNYVLDLNDYQQGVYSVTVRTKSGKVLYGKVVKR